jgi:nucleotide-binding universal stress UspA family protein
VVTLTHVLHGQELEVPREIRSAQHVEAVLRAKEWLADHDIDTEIRDVEHPYPPTDGIIALAEKIDADAIVLSGRKRSAIGSALFGSVVQSIINNTTRPVVIVNPDDT